MIAAAPARKLQPFAPPTVAPGFQKIADASLHGDPVTANERDAAQEPISLMPNPCACARGVARARVAMTARYRVERCSGISILRCFRTRTECAMASCRLNGRRMECEACGSVEGGREDSLGKERHANIWRPSGNEQLSVLARLSPDDDSTPY